MSGRYMSARVAEIAAVALLLGVILALAALSTTWWWSGLQAEQAATACQAVYPEIPLADCLTDPRLRDLAAERYGR